MQNLKNIDRSKQNERDVIMTDVPKSGFNLTYSSHVGGLSLGRLYPTVYQHLMPADKISGSNEASLIFEKLSTPVVGDMDICQHNFLVTLRSIDNQWEKFMTPTKLNNMNASVSVPTFNLNNILQYQLKWFIDTLFKVSQQSHMFLIKFNTLSSLNGYKSLLNGLWNNVYCQDSLYDLRDQIWAILAPTSANPQIVVNSSISDADKSKLKLVLYALYDFFVGKKSLLDFFGYPIVTHKEIDAYVDALITASASAAAGSDIGLASLLISLSVPHGFLSRTYPDCNEYLLRAYYAIWFEYYRNFDLEPRSNNLPEYRNFGATSIFYIPSNPQDISAAETLHYLIPRIRSWQTDAFIAAGIDDISRHVFAPVYNDDSYTYQVDVPEASLDSVKYLSNRLVSQNIQWRNSQTGQLTSVEISLPFNLMNQFKNPNSYTTENALELFSLKKAQMLENFLKRIYYGGDEYRDRMLSLYGARIEDYRINRPKWLSSSLDSASPRQEVANTGIAPTNSDPDVMPIGGRIATATAAAQGSDGFTDFCPEFAVYVGITSIMPRVTYNPLCYQNLQKKYSDFPIPQFANQLEDNICTAEVSRDCHNYDPFGFAPYGHSYRYRVDEVHGDYLDTRYDYVFSRFFGVDSTEIPKLNWQFIHCRPKLPMFVNTVLLDGQVYGDFKHNFLVERTLPVPVETI